MSMSKKTNNEANNYRASEIKVLEGLEPVRKRPGMHIGSTDARGLYHLAKEILDNVVDEATAGRKSIQPSAPRLTRSAISLEELKVPAGDESITVADHGRGIPVDMHERGFRRCK